VNAGERSATLLARFSPLLLALGAMLWLEAFYTIEWSFPYCLRQADGPASAVFGMPLPYIRWSMVSSLEYLYMPLVYAINILLLSALAWPLAAVATRPLARRVRVALGALGAILIFVPVALHLFLVSAGAWRATDSIATLPDAYADFRPVRFMANDGHYRCTPAPQWFAARPGK